MRETYNGWSNYETWLIALHLQNDEYFDEVIREYCEDNPEADVRQVGDYIREMLEDHLYEEEKSLLKKDLFHAVLVEVNWTEIAKSY